MPKPETDESVDDFSTARRGLRQFLNETARELKKNRCQIGVDALCVGIEMAIPVPVLNKVLSNSVRRALTNSIGSPELPIDEVLELLEEMQDSDEAFVDGLRQLGADLETIAADVRAVRSLVTEQRASNLRFLNPRVDNRWPWLDSTISAVVANAGGGSVYLDEIFLDVEKWEPEMRIDYSVPAAPLGELHLRVELETEQSEYPLLALNGEGSRLYNEHGGGSERVTVDLSSQENARYSLRLRLPYTDLDGGASVLTYPTRGDEPVTLPFAVAPGWRDVEPSRLHNAEHIYADLVKTLASLGSALRSYREVGDQTELDQKLEHLHIPRYVIEDFVFPLFLSRFVPFVDAVVPAGERDGALATVMMLLLQVEPISALLDNQDVSMAVRGLARGTALEPAVAAFLSAPSDRRLHEDVVVLFDNGSL